MATKFPSDEWAKALMEKLNTSAAYAEVAKNWEGDCCFVVEPDPGSTALSAPFTMYMDLWHGKCRDAFSIPDPSAKNPAFIFTAPLSSFVRIIKGELEPIQAMLTRKLSVKGSMVTVMRNVPTVLEFVKTCTLVESEFAL
ncbi:MAG: SCP2 sterol-binding domain-containing protein [Chloroflexi bacterium]|nr:SCP2 sterol-binding domain-containing protein [Chloroflexota bacterium]